MKSVSRNGLDHSVNDFYSVSYPNGFRNFIDMPYTTNLDFKSTHMKDRQTKFIVSNFNKTFL